MRKPDFNNILTVLNKQKPDRFTLFEYHINNEVFDHFTQSTSLHASPDPFMDAKYRIEAFKNAGYDYAHVTAAFYTFQYGKFNE